jgi:hopanoid biosynthesis associated radical SAM protein HpnH
MKFPISLTAGMAKYIVKNKMNPRPEWQKTVVPAADASNPFRILPPKTGEQRKAHPMINKRFPIVLMLEPLHACNLTCTGCGRIREYEQTISQRVPLEECLAAVDECGAPIVSICGGEPMMYPQIGELVSGILERNRQIFLCTNGMFIKRRIHEFRPDRRFFINVHLDGMEKNHDLAVERDGVFKEAVEGIKIAKAAGFLVCTNTTVYKETDMKEIEEMFQFLEELGVDGHQIAPAYGYSAVNDREIFMTRDDINEKFRDFDRVAKRYNVKQTPMYLDFLQGRKELPCTAWGNPTYNIKGWKGPCYLITDGHYKTFEQLMTHTPWETYGPGNDPRCEHCMMHCGFEPSAALGINAGLSDNLKLITWALR